MRPTLAQARSQYVHRFTMEHVPQWARTECGNGKFYAPQYSSDSEWYEHTVFPEEESHPDFPRKVNHCYATGQTWPRGLWLDVVFH